jgi:predicted AAA+ superfamily ATPase
LRIVIQKYRDIFGFAIKIPIFACDDQQIFIMIKRVLENQLRDRLFKGKALIIMGPRQVGKTTLLRQLLDDRSDVLWLNGDEQDVRNIFENISSTRLKSLIGNNKVVVIDEAQRISDIGIKLKLITDQIPEVQLVATGSSSFELANLINEPLTGRKWEYRMFPVSFEEMCAQNGLLKEKRMLPHRMIYGYYPEIVMHQGDEETLLAQLSDSYLYRDILTVDKIKKSEKIVKLLQAIAFQVGSEVSYNELGQLCGLDSKTVAKYVTLLEQSYIIFRLGSYSRNLRNELKFSRKIYFVDNGIRNAIIGNFTQIENRTDVGILFENFVISERMKLLKYHVPISQSWFWRTTAKQEVDYIEQFNGKTSAYEFKWNPRKKVSVPASFAAAYPEISFTVINNDNIEDFLLKI